jgi:FkbH-like protein
MTTIRRTESQISQLMSADQYDVFTLRLSDRFGDNGIVGMAVVEHKDQEDVLETFLMSCRVLGRTVETAFLSWIGTESLNRGLSRLVALYRPTSNNMQFAEFYKSWGMRLDAGGVSENTQRWRYDLAPGRPELELPPWIEIRLIPDEGG